MRKVTQNRTTNTGKQDQSAHPRAIIHKQILDAAESRSDASIDELAADVSGASPNLVEQVLENYGDPAVEDPPTLKGEQSAGESETTPSVETESAMDDGDNGPDGTLNASQLNEKQRQTLRAIYEDPDATQGDLGERFDVTSATINQRVNSIDGFDWGNRERLVTQLFENGTSEPMTQTQTEHTNEEQESREELADRVDDLTQQVEALEKQFDDAKAHTQTGFSDSDLMHKTMHACLHSDRITEDEELQIIESLLPSE